MIVQSKVHLLVNQKFIMTVWEAIEVLNDTGLISKYVFWVILMHGEWYCMIHPVARVYLSHNTLLRGWCTWCMYQIIGTWAVTLHNCNIKAQAMSLNLTEVYKRVPVEDLDNNTPRGSSAIINNLPPQE